MSHDRAGAADRAAAIDLPLDAIPVIDFAPFRDGSDPERVAAEIADACRRIGFFYLVGHGISPERLTEIMAATRALFTLSAEEKAAIASDGRPGARGYTVMPGQAELPAPARKEEYYLGRGGDNRWPATLPAFRTTMSAYVADLHDLAERVMKAMALSLDLPVDHFAAFCTDPIAALRLVHYPAEASGAGAHSDFGSLTLLLQDDVGGLEVWDQAGERWITAPPIPGSFVVNIGDLFERWTNGRYRSTIHRVVHRTGVERFSVPFFLTGAADHPIEALPSCIAPGETPKFAPTTVAGHLAARFAGQGF